MDHDAPPHIGIYTDDPRRPSPMPYILAGLVVLVAVIALIIHAVRDDDSDSREGSSAITSGETDDCDPANYELQESGTAELDDFFLDMAIMQNYACDEGYVVINVHRSGSFNGPTWEKFLDDAHILPTADYQSASTTYFNECTRVQYDATPEMNMARATDLGTMVVFVIVADGLCPAHPA